MAETYRINKKKSYRSNRTHFLKTCLIVAAVCLVVFIAAVMLTSRQTSARNLEQAGETYYTSYRIKSGDTLWTIAERYCGSQYGSTREYIDEVCRINHLSDCDCIISGQNICIPCLR